MRGGKSSSLGLVKFAGCRVRRGKVNASGGSPSPGRRRSGGCWFWRRRRLLGPSLRPLFHTSPFRRLFREIIINVLFAIAQLLRGVPGVNPLDIGCMKWW